ncbi:MAG TPA: hypothetical protein VH592_22080 [Gemmataceae bacterium]|jgi:hypothetical protein
MAFHPFKHFRKHQKKYLALLTVMTMFIFVAQFGAGDVFSSLQRWVALSVHRGDKVLTLYGKTVYSDELERLRWQRQLASEFLVSNSWVGAVMSMGQSSGTPLEKSFFDVQAKFGPKKDQKDPSPMQTTLSQVYFALILASNPRFSTPETRLSSLQKQLRDVQRQLSFPEAQKNEAQYKALDTLATILAFYSWAMDPQRQLDDSYFGGSLRATEVSDSLDFLIWKQQADRLGIVLTPGDVAREINRAWGNGDYLPTDGKFETNEWVTFFFRNNQRVHKSLTPRDLLNALTDEFRVAMAKEAILGSAGGVRSYRQAVDGIHFSPSAATPDEFYQYFRDQRTALSVSILPIPVKEFVDKVQAKPTEADLRNLYERYKNDEPVPARRQPGFKEPRRIKLQYLSFRPEGSFARKLADKALSLLPVFRVGQPAAPFAAGGGLVWAAHLASYADEDAAVRALYTKYREEENRRVPVRYDRDDTTRFGLSTDLPGQQSLDVQASTAFVGQLLGSFGTGATPLAAPTAWLAANESQARATLTAYATAVLAGASSSPLPAMTLPMRYLYTTQPFEAVRDQLRERFVNTLSRTLMDSNVLAFRKELDKVLAMHSEQKLDEFLKKAVPEHGLEDFRSMQAPQTQQEISDHPDPQLKDLQAAWEASPNKPFQEPPSRSVDVSSFARDMFVPFDTMRQGQTTPGRSEQFAAAGGDIVYVLWKSEDLPAHVRPFDVVRNEVKDAWYLEQARKVARERAQQINAELKKQNLAPDAAVQFLVQQNLGGVFQLDKVSHLTAPEFSLPGQKFSATDYRPYAPPKDFVPYPPSDFVDQLLKLKKRGESLVMTDKPVKHFYIAVLMEDPQSPERKEFYDAYSQTSLPSFDFMPAQEEPLWVKMMGDRQRKFERKVLEELRAEATKDLQDGEYVLPDIVRTRSESSRDTGE